MVYQGARSRAQPVNSSMNVDHRRGIPISAAASVVSASAQDSSELPDFTMCVFMSFWLERFAWDPPVEHAVPLEDAGNTM